MNNQINKIIETLLSANKFNDRLPIIEQKMLDSLLILLKDLEIGNDGRIKSNIKNLKLVNGIKNKLEKLIVNKEYLKDLKDYIRSFDAAAVYAGAYFKSISNKFDSKKPYYAAITKTAIDAAVTSLTKDGISYYVASPIQDKLMTAVTSGQSYASLLGTLQKDIVSSKDNTGSLSRFAGTYSITALSLFTGQYMAAINKDLGFKWFRYVGSNIKTTREFCLRMTEKEWVHESEFEMILSGNIDGYQVRINDATGLPLGMIAGTDTSNFPANAGGWNCQHGMFPVPDFVNSNKP